jgi:hypothetical protein
MTRSSRRRTAPTPGTERDTFCLDTLTDGITQPAAGVCEPARLIRHVALIADEHDIFAAADTFPFEQRPVAGTRRDAPNA